MTRTLLVALELSESSDISSYADEVLDLLESEGLPVTSVVPWGQAALQPPENTLGQMPLPTVQTPPQSDAFSSLAPSDPWLPQ